MSTNSFALNIGLSRGENLYQIKRGNNGISKDLVEQIVKKYPEINRTWLITGEGEMFVSDNGDRVPIPCYDIDIASLARLDQLPQPSHMISLPRMRGVSFAGLTMNAAMEPGIPNGATVVVCEATHEQIVPGYPYVVVTDNIAVLRRLKKEPANDKIRLVAANPDFDDMIIDICEVRKLLMVKGHVFYNQ